MFCFLGDLVVEKEIGRGQFGVVFRGKYTDDKGVVQDVRAARRPRTTSSAALIDSLEIHHSLPTYSLARSFIKHLRDSMSYL